MTQAASLEKNALLTLSPPGGVSMFKSYSTGWVLCCCYRRGLSAIQHVLTAGLEQSCCCRWEGIMKPTRWPSGVSLCSGECRSVRACLGFSSMSYSQCVGGYVSSWQVTWNITSCLCRQGKQVHWHTGFQDCNPPQHWWALLYVVARLELYIWGCYWMRTAPRSMQCNSLKHNPHSSPGTGTRWR